MSNGKWQVGVEYVRNNRQRDLDFATSNKKLYEFFTTATKFTVTETDGGRVIQVSIDGKLYRGAFFNDAWNCIFTGNELRYFNAVVVEKPAETPRVKAPRKPQRTKMEKLFDLAFEMYRDDLIELPNIRHFVSIDDYLLNVKEQIINRKDSMIKRTAELATTIDKIEKVLN